MSGTTEGLTGKTLLIIEDNDIAREGLAVVLRRAGSTVSLAVNGAEALAQLQVKPLPHLILLDMMLPGVDGWHFLDLRAREAEWASIPVIITTGLGVSSPEWAVSLGAAGFLRKPIETEELLREVKRWCTRTSSEAEYAES
jgi:two-component system, chemotaxis family, chemotaxis protein CheY